jgi:hypothetical protein
MKIPDPPFATVPSDRWWDISCVEAVRPRNLHYATISMNE